MDLPLRDVRTGHLWDRVVVELLFRRGSFSCGENECTPEIFYAGNALEYRLNETNEGKEEVWCILPGEEDRLDLNDAESGFSYEGCELIEWERFVVTVRMVMTPGDFIHWIAHGRKDALEKGCPYE